MKVYGKPNGQVSVISVNQPGQKAEFQLGVSADFVAISPNNDLIAAASENGTIKIWKKDQSSSDPPLHEPSGFTDIQGIHFTSDGLGLIIQTKDAVHVYDLAMKVSKEIAQKGAGATTFWSAVSESGDKILVGDDVSGVRVIDLQAAATGAQSQVVEEAEEGYVLQKSIDPSRLNPSELGGCVSLLLPGGQQMVYGTKDGHLFWVDFLDSGKNQELLKRNGSKPFASEVTAIAFANGQIVAASKSLDDKIERWSSDGSALEPIPKFRASVMALSVANDLEIAILFQNKTSCTVNQRRGLEFTLSDKERPSGSHTAIAPPKGISFFIYAFGGPSGAVQILNERGRKLNEISVEGLQALVFTQDGEHLILVTEQGVRIEPVTPSADSPTVTRSFPAEGFGKFVAISSDGQNLLSLDGGVLKTWRLDKIVRETPQGKAPEPVEKIQASANALPSPSPSPIPGIASAAIQDFLKLLWPFLTIAQPVYILSLIPQLSEAVSQLPLLNRVLELLDEAMEVQKGNEEVVRQLREIQSAYNSPNPSLEKRGGTTLTREEMENELIGLLKAKADVQRVNPERTQVLGRLLVEGLTEGRGESFIKLVEMIEEITGIHFDFSASGWAFEEVTEDSDIDYLRASIEMQEDLKAMETEMGEGVLGTVKDHSEPAYVVDTIDHVLNIDDLAVEEVDGKIKIHFNHRVQLKALIESKILWKKGDRLGFIVPDRPVNGTERRAPEVVRILIQEIMGLKQIEIFEEKPFEEIQSKITQTTGIQRDNIVFVVDVSSIQPPASSSLKILPVKDGSNFYAMMSFALLYARLGKIESGDQLTQLLEALRQELPKLGVKGEEVEKLIQELKEGHILSPVKFDRLSTSFDRLHRQKLLVETAM
ncbi:MAG: WD40 repeat domain-containing protein [Chlamydiae bacterium]|nr:WD40 repeat domain-containing protein [Chlamydiota bacterium]